MPRLPRIVLSVQFLAAFLTACASEPPLVTKLERVAQPIPPELLVCAPEPVPPAGNLESDAGAFLVDALDAGADCRSKLAEVRALVTP